jgi:Asp-tRNA(Asn)/Glu-tRNA(Gln) amidotransferase A subunit family amidase
MSDPSLLPATAAVRGLRTGTLSASELTDALLARIAAREPDLRAFAWHDPASARRAAARADATLRSGRPLGPLHGLAFGIKDVLDTADMPSQYGSPIWAGHRPRADAAAVAMARRAGAIAVGKTVTTEFATRYPGPTANPRNPAHTPGGRLPARRQGPRPASSTPASARKRPAASSGQRPSAARWASNRASACCTAAA